MQTAKPTKNLPIAIVGMNAHFGNYGSLDAFERSIYEGHLPEFNHLKLSTKEILARYDRIASIALEDAAIDSDVNIAIIVAQDSKQKLDSTVTMVDSVFDALLIAQELLGKSEVTAVLVGGVDFASQAVGAVVLKRYETAKSDRNRIYAVINALSSSTPVEAPVTYLELLDDRRLESVEIEQRIPNYLAANPACSCAVSSVTNAGYQGITAQMASLIKTTLCLYYRYIPPVPQWDQQTPKSNHPFYVATFAKPWFLSAGVNQRVAAINIVSNNAQIILAEEVASQRRSQAYLEQMPCYLFPLAADDPETLLKQLDTFKQTIKDGDLAQIARQTFITYQHQADYILAIVGKNEPEILKECDRATQGVAKAFETGKDWQTPIGSYFTAHPQGQKGKVAYVYPGAYNAHVGLGKDLFRLFPNLIDEPVIKSTCNRVAGIEKLLYPRSWHKLTPRELEAKEGELMNDPLAMLESETGFAGFMTTILRDYFQVKPQAAFGYSLGETSMMYAQGVWGDIDRSSDVLNTSPLFKTRLAGTKEAVREYWQLANEQHQQQELWRTYVVMANSELVQEKLQGENRVYLTQISTPKEVVIAGDPQSCERVIASLGCDAFRAPFNHVIHCEAIKSEYDELIKLNTLPVNQTPEITFYSAANYQEIKPSSQEIAHSLTQTLIHQLDFPRLVERVYQDDYRIFIEVGVGSNCSRWIKDILQSKKHAVISLHRRGTNEFTSLLKAIAKLLSHHVQLDLSPLYGVVEDSTLDQPVFSPTEHKILDPWQESVAEKGKSSADSEFKPPRFEDRSPDNLANNKTSLDLEKDPHNLIQWQPTFLQFNNGLSHNNTRLSQAHSAFIEQDQEYSLNNKEAIDTHIKVLEKMIKKFKKRN
jgi:PfaB family protein